MGVAPRVFLRKLVADVLDRVEEFSDFDPRSHYRLTLAGSELTDVEQNAAALRASPGGIESEGATITGAVTADEVELDL